jgi:hypothetical protein
MLEEQVMTEIEKGEAELHDEQVSREWTAHLGTRISDLYEFLVSKRLPGELIFNVVLNFSQQYTDHMLN